MTEHEITTPEDLDAALSARGLRKRARLWKVAAGQSFSWVEGMSLACAMLLLGTGFIQLFDASGGTVQFALGLALLVSLLWSHSQRQLNALAEIVKRLEQERA